MNWRKRFEAVKTAWFFIFIFLIGPTILLLIGFGGAALFNDMYGPWYAVLYSILYTAIVITSLAFIAGGDEGDY